MNYRRRSAPVSTLRARLQQRMSDKNDWEEQKGFGLEAAETEERTFSPAAIFKTMHRYLLIKITLAVAIIFITALLMQGSYSWGAPLLRALHFAVEWDLELHSLTGKVIPAFHLIRDQGVLPLQLPGGRTLPFTGNIESGFGLRDDPGAGGEQMHYGVDLTAPEGTAVRSILAGKVGQVAINGDGALSTVLIDADPGWVLVYRNLVGTDVGEGDAVEPGTLLGKLGSPGLYDLPHLHLELRYKGRPVPLPEDWILRLGPIGAEGRGL